MTRGQFGEGSGHAVNQLNLLVGDGLSEADNAGVLLGRDGRGTELFEAGNQRLAEALQAVALRLNGCPFDLVEVLADLFGRVHAVVEVGDERGDGSLEVDVVLPQRVVGVEEQGPAGRLAGGLEVGVHWQIYSPRGGIPSSLLQVLTLSF